MKKSLVALAALAAVGAASAQSTVTISGAMALGVGATKTATNSGMEINRQTGNLQFAGTEDLGGGLRAGFQLQTSIGGVAETDAAAADTILGDRAANMTLSGNFGTLLVGRTNTAIRTVWGAIGDVSGLPVISGLSAGSGDSDAKARVIYGDTFTNVVGYSTPTMGGFSASLAVAPVAGTTATTKDTYNLTLRYGAGPLAAAVVYTDAKKSAAAASAGSITTALASYDFGVAKVGVTFQTIAAQANGDPGDAYALTAAVPVGAGNVGFGYGKRKASGSTHAALGGDNVSQVFVGYKHNLSKRTAISLVYNKLNRAGTTDDVRETHVVVAHTF